MKLNFLYSNIQADVATIEEELRRAVASEQAPLIEEAALQLLDAGGKRIRPIFVCLTARLGQFEWNQVEQAAVAVELIHMASIVHDDVVDDADVRRGLPTIKSKWGEPRCDVYRGLLVCEVTGIHDKNYEPRGAPSAFECDGGACCW